MDNRNGGRRPPDRSKTEYRNRRKKQKLRMMRIRAAVMLVLVVCAVCAILFITPVFDIKNISVSGNNVITLEQINECIGDVVGKNLFSTWSSSLEKRLKTIAYIDEVSVSKKVIPPTIYVSIKECETAAYFEKDGKKIIINPDLKVLDDSNTFSLDNVPLVRGVEIGEYTVGKILKISDEEKSNALGIFLRTMYNIGQIENVLYLDISSITDIKFNYNGTLDVNCGSSLELDKKLRMFKAAMTNGSIKENARGTIDLSDPERAVYTP